MLVVVQLQTDISSRNEFVSVRTTIGDEEHVEPVGDIESFLEPVAMAELRASVGTIRIRMQLLDDRDRIVAERLLIAEVSTDTALVVFVGASCRGVVCTREDQTCIRGMCVDATSICGGRPCRPGDCPGGVCGVGCSETSECPPFDVCSDPECRGTVCIGVPREGACAPGFYCAVGIGCITVPPDTNPDGGLPEGGLPDGALPDGGMEVEYCTSCTTSCGTVGMGVCIMGFPTGECVAPEERCNDMDDDCDGSVDEGLDCGHSHVILCQVGLRMRPDMTFEPNIISSVTGGGPGLICGGAVCQSFIGECSTSPGGDDGHIHAVSIGGGATLTIADDVPFSSMVRVDMASGHTHGATCGIGSSSAEIAGGFYFHRIMDDGGDPTRFDQFCVPPVGSPDSECRPAFGFCQTD